MLYHLVPESCGISRGLAKWSHSVALTRCKAWTCSEWAPDFQCRMQPLKVRGHHAVNHMGQVECGSAAPLVAFPDTSLSHDDRSLACYFCHLVVSMACLGSRWLCLWRARPILVFSGQAQLHFLCPYQASPVFPKLLLSHLGNTVPAENNEKNNWPGEMSISPLSPVYHDLDG